MSAYGFDNQRKKAKVLFERMEQALLLNQKMIGETAIKEARLNGSYTDRTGNLRNSVGYRQRYEGKIAEAVTAETKPVLTGAEGADLPVASSECRAALDAMLADISKRKMALCVVAGMSYGVFVEHNYNVLSSARRIAFKMWSDAVPRVVSKTIKQLYR